MKPSINRRFRGLVLAACVVAVAVATGEIARSSTAAGSAVSAKTSSAPLVVWYDAARAAYVKEYKATHPGANIKWVLYSGDNNGDGTLQSKFSLFNRTGWKAGVAPDVVFDEENYEAGWLGEPPFNDLLDLSKYIPKSVWSQDEGLGDCLINGKLLCLRNDNAANVLWVNTKLWNQFFPGKQPPTTWAQYAADGKALMKSHPGYYIGEFGQPWDAETYLWGNECPINQSVGNQTLVDNPASPNCTTIAKLIDSSLGAFTHNGPFTTAWVADKTAQHMVMDIGAIWQGGAIYPSGSSSEGPGTNVMEAYPPPVATNGAHVTGSIGGGLWMVSSHTTQPQGRRSARAVHGHEPEHPVRPGCHAGAAGLRARPGRMAEVTRRGLRQPVGDRGCHQDRGSRDLDGLEPGAVERGVHLREHRHAGPHRGRYV